MPGMEGYELCRLIKKDDQLKGIPVMLLTGLEILGEQPTVQSETVRGVAVLLESQEAMILNPDLPLPVTRGGDWS